MKYDLIRISVLYLKGTNFRQSFHSKQPTIINTLCNSTIHNMTKENWIRYEHNFILEQI